jgi:undecaprenyl diphosphate synthase
MSNHNEKIPAHVAIIMDGNGRWAKKRFLPRFAGHKAGVDSVKRSVEFCVNRGVRALTLFAFSSENWKRPAQEVSLLMDLFIGSLKAQIKILHKENIRLRVIGDISAFPEKLQAQILDGEALTRENTSLDLVIAANYGGRWDIVQSVRQVATRVLAGECDVDDISESHIAENLMLSDLPPPDLFIRTGGECRVSNFMLWQLAYAEMYFTDLLWPEFGVQEFEKALDSFSSRQRRFGKTGDQVEAE